MILKYYYQLTILWPVLSVWLNVLWMLIIIQVHWIYVNNVDSLFNEYSCQDPHFLYSFEPVSNLQEPTNWHTLDSIPVSLYPDI